MLIAKIELVYEIISDESVSSYDCRFIDQIINWISVLASQVT